MCHLSMKLPDMFDPNPMYTSDNTINVKNMCPHQDSNPGNSGKTHFCERNTFKS